MKQYECDNIPQVAHKVAELTNTKVDRLAWKEYCDNVKKSNLTSDTVDYTAWNEQGIERDVSIFFGWDGKQWLVGICDE